MKCETCLEANLTNTCNKVMLNTTMYNYLEKVSSDLCGLINLLTYNKYKYIITFLDKAMKYLEVALLKLKDEAITAFKVFKAKAENELDSTM